MDWKKYTDEKNWHRYANVFPMMTPDELASLVDNISEHKLQQPITLFEGKILDGRNRILACAQANVTPTFKEFHPNGTSPLEFVVAANLERRHLTVTQRGVLAREVRPKLAKEASARQVAAGKHGNEGGRGHRKPKPLAQNKAKGKSTAKAAAMFGVSASTVEKIERIAKTKPRLLRAMKEGRISLQQADKKAHCNGTLADQYGAPPFTVFDTKKDYWTLRKEWWIQYGANGSHDDQRNGSQPGESSKFDPMLAELVYRWFCPPAGSVLDPCAGECVKGIVAAHQGLDYTGLELRASQIKTNRARAAALQLTPKWLQCDSGNSTEFDKCIPKRAMYDLVFTSPPYYQTEIYSDQDKDSSTFENYPAFMVWYEMVFRQAVAHLKPNRFLVVKIGEGKRDENGFFYNLVGDSISCFLKLGLKFYNQAILNTKNGSAPTRVRGQFPKYRKLVSTHQTLLVFFNGDDPRVIPTEFGVLNGKEYGTDTETSASEK